MTSIIVPYAIFAVMSDQDSPEPTRFVQKLRRMRELQAGWSHGAGVPVTDAAIRTGERFVALAFQLQLKVDVFPDPDGGCAVAFYSAENRVEVMVPPTGAEPFGLRVERGIGFQFEDVIAPTD